MSLINDALKRARQTEPDATPAPLPQIQPVAQPTTPVAGRMIPAVVIVLIVAAVFFIGWAMAHRSMTQVASVSPPVVAVTAPVPTPPPGLQAAVSAVAVSPPVPAAPPVKALPLPKLQGIFYSPTAPAAIVDGQTVRLGDQLNQYRVKAITKTTVTLVDAGGKTASLTMNN